MNAMSCGLVEQVRKAAMYMRSGPATTLSASWKPSTSVNSFMVPSRSSPYSRQWSKREGAMPLRSSG
ncbi:hypothetical protein D3C72_2453980 [compost metagenome]